MPRPTADECREQGICYRCRVQPRTVKGQCESCAERHKAWRAANHDRLAVYEKTWAQKNPDKVKATQQRYSKNHPDKMKEIWKNAYWRTPDAHRTNSRLHALVNRVNLRQAAIAAYGNKCSCCGESTFEFLTIDHVDGNGVEHRKAEGIMTGTKTYRWLRDNNYPTGFQVLCYNCNCAKGAYGSCPHTRPPE